MRIGEVSIVSHKSQENEAFIRSICRNTDIDNEKLCFGRFVVNDQLLIYLYGISNDYQSQSLDLISQKTLGFIIIFDWKDKKALEITKSEFDYFSRNFKAPIIIVANIKNKKESPIPESLFQLDGIFLSPNCRFTFGQVDDPESARNVMILLVNMLLEKLSKAEFANKQTTEIV